MKLQLINVQGGSFDKYYSRCLYPPIQPSLIEAIEKVKGLFYHLEHNVEGPNQWVTISYLVHFYLSDTDDWRPEKARVFVNLRLYGYEIKYRSARELHYRDSFTTVEARNHIEAGDMIAEALERAVRNLPDLPGRCG